ncbi:MAG: hypothetical protein OXC37_03670 [Bdellovibrionaceae bacterium]|nr:hypothetical protein [Pseudobdellovibrionaceae bacterium]
MSLEDMSLFQLLEQKNSYLLKFHEINKDELERLSEGSTDNLENFYYSREILLNAIKKLDDQTSNKIKAVKVNKQEKKKLIDILNLKRKMILSILDQDLAIISLVDEIKKSNKIAV